ncbi:copper amine oxidase N-terminal domain-containing protein [Paenibacillus puldeungensis]|uniref:Copper amine oxidase N-terminal domain-containing protein n=1 Tax=Paenibacillus puldeungensis TaxID=696536 RepID=A0ABW3S2I4_9BACL
MRKTKWLAIPLVFIMIALAGCQAVSGFDVSKALLGSLKPTSSESKQKLSIEVVPAAGNLNKEDQAAIELINSLALNIDSAKVQDGKNVSMKGSVDFKGNKLPFLMSMDTKGIALQVEGAKQPVYISLDAAGLGYPQLNMNEEGIQNFTTKAAEFILKHFPNPSVVTAGQVQEKVNGESLSLTNLHVEIRGDELIGLIKPFLSSIAKDEQGLKELLGTFYDTFYPMMNSINELRGDEKLPEIAPDSKKAAVDEIYTEFKNELDKLLSNYDKEVADLLADTPELSTVLGKNTVLKLDVYFDGKLNIRKQKMDLNIALPASPDLPITAIKVHSESELWNHGGNITIDQVDTKAGTLDMSSEEVTPGQILRNFEAVTPLYKVLKEDLKLGHKSIVIDSLSDYYGLIHKDNTYYIPVRDLAEQLDAEVKWSERTGRLVVVNDLTGEEIVLTAGSKQATVGGKSVTLTKPVFVNKDGTTYVSLRFLAEALGATVSMDDEGWITVERN